MKLKLRKNKMIVKENYVGKDEYEYDKQTNVVPKNVNRLICIMFSEQKGCHFLLRKFSTGKNTLDYFRFNKGIYIIDNESIHICDNGSRIAFYLEGVSTPIKMSNITRETKKIEYTDLYGKKQISVIDKIKGLKFDSKILDIFANRRFAEIFTKQPVEGFQIYLLIIGIISLIMIGAGYVVSYYFR